MIPVDGHKTNRTILIGQERMEQHPLLTLDQKEITQQEVRNLSFLLQIY